MSLPLRFSVVLGQGVLTCENKSNGSSGADQSRGDTSIRRCTTTTVPVWVYRWRGQQQRYMYILVSVRIIRQHGRHWERTETKNRMVWLIWRATDNRHGAQKECSSSWPLRYRLTIMITCNSNQVLRLSVDRTDIIRRNTELERKQQHEHAALGVNGSEILDCPMN